MKVCTMQRRKILVVVVVVVWGVCMEKEWGKDQYKGQ